jgi:GTP-binding protein
MSKMSLPCVAIVGRPNVGKSSLFNSLAKRRIAIVDPTAGVTRDRLSTAIAAGDKWFDLVDTGGVGVVDADELSEDVDRQIRLAMEQAQVILFLVDAREGVTALDQVVAQRIRGLGKPILLVANKCDTLHIDQQSVEFFRLGFGEPLCVSAQHNRNRDQLLNRIGKILPESRPEPEDPVLKIAIVGRRNTGKSTFINCLAGQERVIVSEVAGTTRDSVDVRFEKDGKTVLAIDTAGVRKRRSLKGNIEFYSLARAQRSIRRADVVLLFLEPRFRVSRVDKQLAEYILEQSIPAIFVINKWDLVRERISTSEMGDYIRKVFPSLDYLPIAFITAKTGRNVPVLIDLARSLQKQSSSRAATSELNRVIREAIDTNQPPNRMGRSPRFYYAAQIAESPPTIVLHTNASGIFDPPYIRYLERTIRDRLGFQDVPIRLIIQGKGVTKANAKAKNAENDEDVYEGETYPSSKAIPQPRKNRQETDFVEEFTEDESSGFEPIPAKRPRPERPRIPMESKRPAKEAGAGKAKPAKRADKNSGKPKGKPGKGKQPPSTWDL